MEHSGYNARNKISDRLSVLLIRCGQKLGSAGAHQTQGRILKILYLYGPMTQKVLRDRLAIQPGSMSEIAAKLERKGLLTRQQDSIDKRKVLLSLTDAGRADVEAFGQKHKSAHGRRFDALTPEEQQTLKVLLEKLLESWDTQTPEA